MEDETTPVEETAPAAEVTEPASVEEGQEAAATETAPEAVETTETPEDYKPKGVQKRIDELTREKYEAKRLLDQERAERQRLQEYLTAQQKPQEQTAPPSLEECGWDDEKHRVEVAKWAAKEQFKALQTEEQKQREMYQQHEQRQVFKQAVDGINERGRKDFPDYDSVVLNNPAIVVTETMAAVLAQTENGQKIAYYLGNNPGESHRIASLPEVLQGVEIGRLESRLNSAQKKTTTAPPPIKPVSAAPIGNNEPDSTKNPEAWAKWEAARVKALGRRF